MQKISGILPSSSRITSVDVKEAGNVRPGTPSFGRPLGESNLMQNSVVRSAHQALQKHNELFAQRTREQEQATTIQRMADSFFKNKEQLTRENDLVDEMLRENSMPQDLPPTISIPRLEGTPIVHGEKPLAELTPQDLEAPEVGRYVDVMA